MSLSFNETYVSCGCNRTPHAADWGDNGKICFASCNAVAIFAPSEEENDSQIENVIHLHNDRVNSVRWLRNHHGKTIDAFVSSSADKTATLTSKKDRLFSREMVLIGHGSSVSIADGILCSADDEYIPQKSPLIIATASVDSSVRIWTRNDVDTNKLQCIDNLNLGSGFALDVRWAIAAGSPLLACALDDCKVHLIAQQSTGKYERVHVISGHEDWVRALDFCWHGDNLLLATGSQDTFVRVYQLTVKRRNTAVTKSKEVPDFVETEETEFLVGGNLIGLRLDTVLMGHEGWVYGVAFHRISKIGNEVKLLTSSMDKSLVVWSPQDGLWLETARVGEVGGNTLGFYGGKFSPDGKSVMAHGYQGSFHLWRCSKDDYWEPQVVVGGHLGEVVDMCWSPSGRFLLSVGADQTTRLHAPWNRNGINTWHEIARPQVHGHDMSCIVALTDTSFVSGAEEKVLRAFQAPTNFLDNFRRICQAEATDSIQVEAPEGAAVPALGLSNKPVFHDTSNKQSQKDPDVYFSPLLLNRPPTEENLLQNTLWPEVQKLYGHGYEIHCVAATSDGNFIASACHASNLEHASVIIWDAKTWGQIQKLTFHRLTVTQMAFSPDGSYLVTVSRDRRWCLYRRNDSGLFVTHVVGEKTPHTRIIWCCAWDEDGKVFSTGSRDGLICLWDSHSGSCLAQTNIEQSVTALCFSLRSSPLGKILLAGAESGKIIAYVVGSGSLSRIGEFEAHAGTVRRIHFRPGHDLDFASCSKDFSLRIFKLVLM